MCTTTVTVSADMWLRAAAQLVSESIHTWINIHVWHIYFYIPLWLRSETRVLLSARLLSQHSLPQPGMFSLIRGLSLKQLTPSMQYYICVFLSPSHPLPIYTTVALMYCHTSSGKASESGAHRAQFLIFWLFSHLLLKLPLQTSTSPGIIGPCNMCLDGLSSQPKVTNQLLFFCLKNLPIFFWSCSARNNNKSHPGNKDNGVVR